MDLVEARRRMEQERGKDRPPLPTYQSHKTVGALKIHRVLLDLDGSGIIIPENALYGPFAVTPAYMTKHLPQAGGYFVQYKEGYQSYSPAQPFYEGYKPSGATGSDFAQDMAGIGWAIKQMRNGSRVTRTGWNGKGMYLCLQVPDAGSANTLPYVWLRTVQGDRVPWLASQTDLLATDWELVS